MKQFIKIKLINTTTVMIVLSLLLGSLVSYAIINGNIY
jgi:hypothetical protein